MILCRSDVLSVIYHQFMLVSQQCDNTEERQSTDSKQWKSFNGSILSWYTNS